GSTKEVDVPYTVVAKETDADKSTVAPKKDVTYKQGDPVGKPEDVLTNLPEGSTVVWTKEPDTNTPGKGTAEITVTFPDGSTKTIEVPYTVVPKETPVTPAQPGDTTPTTPTTPVTPTTPTTPVTPGTPAQPGRPGTTGQGGREGVTPTVPGVQGNTTTTTGSNKGQKSDKTADLKDKLQAKIAQGQALDLTNVPKKLRDKLAKALSDGQDVLDNKKATKKQIKAAIKKIQDAIDNAKAGKKDKGVTKTTSDHSSELKLLLALIAAGVAGWWLIIWKRRRDNAVDFDFNEIPSVNKVLAHLNIQGAGSWTKGKAPDTTKVGKGQTGHVTVTTGRGTKNIKFKYNVAKPDDKN
ncbi:MAG: Rib/alpha-like domain-containing protein, partial [Limosilactobacillus sp.]|uniref:Rib/alpha-like domain-containing protein n=1 Tax=Limosilactobacillus sp. TaxID=2773925 RepID=UPI002701A321|nr:Rib/alpha-like domain-containing protein [Limosilactobacillus sp.]